MIEPRVAPRRLSGQLTALYDSRLVYEALIPKDHPLRLIKEQIDFSYVRQVVRDRHLYSDQQGRYALDPELFAKLCFLITYDRVSLREAESRAGTDLVWKFFLDLEVTAPPPFDFSTLSKTRARYGEPTCQALARGLLQQAAAAGVLEAKTLIADSASSYANVAVRKSVELVRRLCDKLREALRPALPQEEIEQWAAQHQELRQDNAWYQSPELKMDHLQQWCLLCAALVARAEALLAAPGLVGQLGDWPRHEQRIRRQLESARHFLADQQPKPPSQKKDQLASDTDPEARHSNRTGDRDKIGYRSHLLMDEDSQLILAAQGTPANTDDGVMLPDLLEEALAQGYEPQELIADSAYADGANRQLLAAQQIEAFIPQPPPRGSRKSKFRTTDFSYDPQANSVTCPAGQLCDQGRPNWRKGGQNFNFPVGVCRQCPLVGDCLGERFTRGRSLHIPLHRPLLDAARQKQKTPEHRRAMKRRLKIERKLEEMLNQHGLRHCWGRGLSRFTLQLYWVVFTVNVKQLAKLLTRPDKPLSAVAPALARAA
jgi:transposase